MDTKLTTIILMLAAAVFIFWGMLYPKFTDVQDVRDEIKANEQEKIRVQESVEDIQEKIEEYESLTSTDFEFIDKALPTNVDIANLYVHINSLVVSSGIIASDISVGDAKPSNSSVGVTAGEVNDQDGPAYKIVPLFIAASGSYESLKNLISKTENTLRITDVQLLQLSSGGGAFNFEIEAQVYYRP